MGTRTETILRPQPQQPQQLQQQQQHLTRVPRVSRGACVWGLLACLLACCLVTLLPYACSVLICCMVGTAARWTCGRQVSSHTSCWAATRPFTRSRTTTRSSSRSNPPPLPSAPLCTARDGGLRWCYTGVGWRGRGGPVTGREGEKERENRGTCTSCVRSGVLAAPLLALSFTSVRSRSRLTAFDHAWRQDWAGGLHVRPRVVGTSERGGAGRDRQVPRRRPGPPSHTPGKHRDAPRRGLLLPARSAMPAPPHRLTAHSPHLPGIFLTSS